MKNRKKFYIIVPAVAVLLCVAVIAAAMILGVPDKVSAAQAGKQIDLGNKYLAAADYDKAEVTFAKALKISPKSVKAATGMAKVYNKKKQPEKAVEYLKKASENLTDGEEAKEDTKEDAKELQKAVTEIKEQIVAQEETGSREQNAENNTKSSRGDSSNHAMTVDLTKIEEIVNGTLGRLKSVAIAKNDTPNEENTEEADTDISGKNSEGLDSGSVSKGTASKNKSKKATATPEPTESPVIIIEPEEDSNTPDITVTGEPDKDPEITVTPEITATPEVTVTPEIPEDPDGAGNKVVDGIPIAKEDEESAPDHEEEGVVSYPETSPIGGDEESEWELIEEGDQSAEEADSSYATYDGTETVETEDPSSDSSDIYTEDPGTETEDMPDTEEISNTDTEDTTASDPESILENYVEDTLSKETPSVSWKDTQIPFTYGESSASALTGRLAVILEDLDGDGTKELLEVEAKDGDLAFNIYKAEDGTAELKASQTVTTGMQTPLSDISYGNTQECFLVNNSGKWEIGFVTYCYGFDSGEGTPAARTEVEVFDVESDTTVKLCASGSVENGQGQENLASNLETTGLTGSWNSINAESLQSIGYAENPAQDLSGVPDPVGEGISTKEKECKDLAVMTVRMAAGSGILTVKSK